MVTKRESRFEPRPTCLILAKNHMVTKLNEDGLLENYSLILAKNHMVTKHVYPPMNYYISLILAKNHMVTKLVSYQ